jgi:hypothetical protein
LHGSSQVRKKDCGTFEYPDHHEFLAIHIARDLRAHLSYPAGDLLMGVKNFETLVGDSGHGDSIT